MTIGDDYSLFAAILTAGAILTGFCGTFLSFRIGREASFERDRRRFTDAFFLLILATFCTLLLGFVLPLFALAGVSWAARPDLMIGGLVAALVLLVSYFYEELMHYEILRTWYRKKERAIAVPVAIVLALSIGAAAWYIARVAAQPEAQAPPTPGGKESPGE